MANSHETTSDTIICPHCGESIPITETLQHQLTENVRKDMQKDLVARERKFAEREEELKKHQEKIAEAEKSFEKRVHEQVLKEREKLNKEAKQKAHEEISVELKDLKEQVAEKEKKLQTARETELNLRKRERELEERQQELAIEVEKRIAKERNNIEEEAAKRLSEEHRLKDAEKDKRINDLLKQLDVAKRKAQQGSQQTQGEVLELVLEDFLKRQFPYDEILEVPKGIRGADVLQKVHNRTGNTCGVIMWESKRTKAWSDTWIAKLKDDQRACRADIAILVSEVLPKDVQGFGIKEGVWISDYAFISGLATALRSGLIQVANTKRAAVGKNEKVEVLFNYLTGPEFRQKVEAIVETFVGMQKDLEEEKRAYQRRWAKREKQLTRVIDSTSGMYGDLQGLIGSPLQTIPALEAGEDGETSNNATVENDISRGPSVS